MVTQTLIPTCKCGAVIVIPEGKTKSRCTTNGCGMHWEVGPEGYWAIGTLTTSFTPIFIESAVTKRKKNSYENYMEWRNANSPKRRRKAGRRDG